MSLNFLQDALAAESARVNQVLREILAALPPSCQPVARHILESGGKRLRPILVILCARACGRDDAAIYPLAASMEMLHAATLLHDDIIDAAASRRGRPAAHTLFGLTTGVLTGDAMLAKGNALVADTGSPALVETYSLATMETAAGAIMENDFCRDPELDWEGYLKIAEGKTARLISRSCRLGGLAADATAAWVEACGEYGLALGMAFQLADDALDFAPAAQTGKPRGGDLREGKMTPPLMLYRESLDAAARAIFDKNFRENSFSGPELEAITVAAARFAGAARARAESYISRAIPLLAPLPDSEAKTALAALARFVESRNK